MTELTEPTRPPEQRGRLMITRRALQTLVVQAATEVESLDVVRNPGSLIGGDVPARPRVALQIDGDQAYVEVEVGLSYPTPLRRAANDLRDHLSRRVEELSGVTVRRLDLKVVWLAPADEQPRRLA